MSVGTAVVNDMFFLHERGEKTGVYTIFVTNGAHFAVLGKYFHTQNICNKFYYAYFFTANFSRHEQQSHSQFLNSFHSTNQP